MHKNDISIPLAGIPSYLDQLQQLLEQRFTDLQSYLFGHIGDGNIHINLKPADGSLSTLDFHDQCRSFDQANTELIQSFHGSISAEHGIGTLKKAALLTVRSETEIQLMQSIKATFDPDWILNPGKIFDRMQDSGIK